MKRQVKVGLVVLLSIILIYFIISWTKNSGIFNQDTKNYLLFFRNVNGLKTHDPVTMYGYEVGQVNNIEPTDSGMIVKVDIDKGIVLYSDASAKILLKEVMGSKQVDLNPGISKIKLKEGNIILGKPTFDFTTAMDKIGEVFEKIRPETIRNTIENLEQISTQLAKFTNDNQMNQIKGMIDNMSSSLSKVDRILADTEQRQIIKKLDSTFFMVNTLTQEISKTLNQFQSLGTSGEKLIPKIDNLINQTDLTLKNADNMITEIQKTLSDLKNKKSVMGTLMYDSTYVNKLDSSIFEVNKTMQHFRNKAINVRMRVFKMP